MLNTDLNNAYLVRIVLLVITLLGSLIVKSQTIPWAIEQPKWVFPIIAKNGTGKGYCLFVL